MKISVLIFSPFLGLQGSTVVNCLSHLLKYETYGLFAALKSSI